MTADEQMIEALRDGLHGLHIARMALVAESKALRLAGRKAEREKVWARVEEITAQIEVTNRELAEHMLREEETQRRRDAETRWTELGVKVWRDPAVEMPPERESVVVKVNDDEDPIRAAWNNGHDWMTVHTGMDLIPTVIGWMHTHEAVEILDAARKVKTRERSGE